MCMVNSPAGPGLLHHLQAQEWIPRNTEHWLQPPPSPPPRYLVLRAPEYSTMYIQRAPVPVHAGMCGSALLVDLKTERVGARNTYWPRRSLYVGGIVLRGPIPGRAPHTYKLHTQVLRTFHGCGQQWSSTIVFSFGLLLPTAVVWAVFGCTKE